MCKIITSYDLDHRSDNELCALFQKVSQDLTKSEPGTYQRRNALASIENISRELNRRRAYRLKPPGC